MELRARRAREALDRARLVDDSVVHVLRRDLHRPAAEALDVGKRGMRADSDAMIDREADSLADGGRVTAVEAARDVRRSDVRHDFGISAHLPGAVAFTHVAIEIDAFHSVIQATQACAMGEQFSPGDAEEDGAGPGEPAVELAAE